jgi:hypothetical protein
MKIVFALCLVCLSGSVGAAPKNEATAEKVESALPSVPAKKSADSSTSHNFEDLLVQGKYHFSDEAVTTVEEDKVLDALIGVRSDFKDRLKSSTGSY